MPLASVSWKHYADNIDLTHEICMSHHYDKGFLRPTLPDQLKDPFVKIMLEHGYFVHEFAVNSSVHSPIQNTNCIFDVYVVGYTHPHYEGQGYLADLFRKLSGLYADKKRERPSVIDSKFRIVVETVIGETNMWQAGSTLLSTVQEIRDYCVRAGCTILEGNENLGIIDLTLKLILVGSEIKRRIEYIQKRAETETIDMGTITNMMSKNRESVEAMVRMDYERARNTHMPLLENFLANKNAGERKICIYSPELLRNPAFIGGYRPEAFGETQETYYGGLRELAKKYQVNYITFMRPAAQLRIR